MSSISKADKKALDVAWEKVLRGAGMQENHFDFGLSQVLGGAAVFQDGIELSGTYDGNVVVNGSATITGDVLVNGSLFVTGDLTNDQGHACEIRQDLNVQDTINFGPSTSSGVSQAPLFVDGNCRFGEFHFNVNSGETPFLQVGGDLISTDSYFDGGGKDGADGLDIYVYGDFVCYYVSLAGGDATVGHAAGDGGYLFIQGAGTFDDGIDFNGGDSDYDNMNAGNGGEIECYGNLVGYFYGIGGTANGNSYGGNGGEVRSYQNATLYWTSVNGGDCFSNNPVHSAGHGGYIVSDGDLDGDGPIFSNGGFRSGVFTTDVSMDGNLNAGNIDVYGDMLASHVELNGGPSEGFYQVDQTTELVLDAGSTFSQADYLVLTNALGEVWGFWYDIDSDGTPPTSVDFGTISGDHQIKVSISGTATDATVATTTLSAITSAVSSKFTVSLHDVVNITIVDNEPGESDPAASHLEDGTGTSAGVSVSITTAGVNHQNAPGGDGGNVNVKGDAILYSLYMEGGSGERINGGQGGSVTTKGRLHCSEDLFSIGGNSNVTNGGPGNITAKSGMLAQNLLMVDGTGDGAVPGTSIQLRLAGSCHITGVDITDRTDAFIYGYNNQDKITLSIATMTDKTTLNQPNGDATVDVSEFLQDSIFSYDPAGGWVRIAGTGLGEG